MLKLYDISLRPIPPNWHLTNMLEPRHGPIRSILIRFRHAHPETPLPVLELRAVGVSNDLYGSNVVSAYEAAKKYTRPVHSNVPPVPVDNDLLEAHANLAARHKLTRILQSHSLAEHNFHLGDLVQVYQKRGQQKRGKWLSPRQVIDIDKSAGMLSVPGSAGHKITVAFEDARAAHMQSDITNMIHEAIDKLDDDIDELLSTHQSPSDQPHQHSPATIGDGKEHPPTPDVDSSDDDFTDMSEPNQSHDDGEESTQPGSNTVADHATQLPSPSSDDLNSNKDVSGSANMVAPAVQDRVEMFWPDHNKYYKGHVLQITDTGQHVITYDDKKVETLTMANETWLNESSVHAATGNFSMLPSDEHRVLKKIMDIFGNKPFLRHQAQGFDQFPIVNAYQVEDNALKKNVCVVKRCNVPPGSNVTSSHVIYKVKMK